MTITRGFCKTKEQHSDLLAHGVEAAEIYQHGRGAEDFAWCYASFRGRPGQLIVADDMRLFGRSKKEVSEALAKLERAKIRVIDITHPEDQTYTQLYRRAENAISGGRFENRRQAKRLGAQGGRGKGRRAAQRRNEQVSEDIVRRIVRDRRIPWDAKVDALGISENTLRRHYHVKPPKKRRRRSKKARA